MTITEVDFDEKKNERLINAANQRKIRENKESELVEIETDEPDPEPLQMEHFHLPLGMWMVGILTSLLFFIAEIIKHRCGGY